MSIKTFWYPSPYLLPAMKVGQWTFDSSHHIYPWRERLIIPNKWKKILLSVWNKVLFSDSIWRPKLVMGIPYINLQIFLKLFVKLSRIFSGLNFREKIIIKLKFLRLQAKIDFVDVFYEKEQSFEHGLFLNSVAYQSSVQCLQISKTKTYLWKRKKEGPFQLETDF